MAELQAQGIHKTTCVKDASLGTGANASTPIVGPAAAFPNPEINCAKIEAKYGFWRFGREWLCVILLSEIITIEVPTGRWLGSATFHINHAVGLDPRSGTWTTFVSYFKASAEGDSASLISPTTRCTGCTGAAFARPLPFDTPLVLGQAVAGQANLSDNPAPGIVNGSIMVSFDSDFSCFGCGVSHNSVQLPGPIRCDAQARVGSAQGCAVAWFPPTFEVNGYVTGNTSAALMLFTQTWNVDHWGQFPLGRPLHRLNNPTLMASNRTAICKGFTTNPFVVGDECDEFPMAATYESGAMSGLKLADCSQVVPVFTGGASAGTWSFYTYPGYSPGQHCAVGHVNSSDNRSTGGQYGAFITNNRVLDKDAFWFTVS